MHLGENYLQKNTPYKTFWMNYTNYLFFNWHQLIADILLFLLLYFYCCLQYNLFYFRRTRVHFGGQWLPPILDFVWPLLWITHFCNFLWFFVKKKLMVVSFNDLKEPHLTKNVTVKITLISWVILISYFEGNNHKEKLQKTSNHFKLSTFLKVSCWNPHHFGDLRTKEKKKGISGCALNVLLFQNRIC